MRAIQNSRPSLFLRSNSNRSFSVCAFSNSTHTFCCSTGTGGVKESQILLTFAGTVGSAYSCSSSGPTALFVFRNKDLFFLDLVADWPRIQLCWIRGTL